MSTAILAENISKQYRLGTIDRSILWKDAAQWWRGLWKTNQEDDSEFWALKDVSFEVKEGENIGIIGKNGAGKSTLLKILARIVSPTRGHVRIKGRVGSLLEVGTGFNPELTGRENVFLNGSILGMNRFQIQSKFDDIVSFAGLEQFIDTPVKRYSSGMQTRLAFAVASFFEPEILILDEVLAVGDMTFRRKCYERMEYLIKNGHTILLVAHDIGAVVKFCTRVFWLEKGELRFDGPAEQGCDSYREWGMRNLLQSRVEADDNGVYHYELRSKIDGNRLWTVSTFAVCNAQGRPVSTLRLGQPCQFQVGFRCAESTLIQHGTALCVMAVFDEQGQRIFALRTDCLGMNLEKLSETGLICFNIPKLPLLPGSYTAFLRLFANGETSDLIQSAASFEVSEGDFYGSALTPLRAFTPICVEASAKLEKF